MREKCCVWLAVLWLVPGAWSQCIPGLSVYSGYNMQSLLGEGSCGLAIHSSDLSQPPALTFSRARSNDSYLLMMLQSVARRTDVYILHWLVSGVKSQGVSLQTLPGGRELTPGYLAPANQTQYELRVYNTTGTAIWEPVSPQERYDFFPSQWLDKNRVYSGPLARTLFSLIPYRAGPPGWAVSALPPGQVPSFPQQPQPPPSHPNHSVQPYPQPPLVTYPLPQPPPVLTHPQPPQPPPVLTHPQPPPQPPTTLHTAARALFINGTRFSVHQAGQPLFNPLNINSTIYSSDLNNKSFRLSPYLIIDNVSYIQRSLTHAPGKGSSYFINGTLYVPFTPPKEVHHHHYHKGAASSLTPTLLFLLSLVPFLALYHST